MKQKTFKEKVLTVVKKFQKVKLLPINKAVAQKAGSKNAFCAVGTILKGNLNPSIPCHRVVRSDGEIGNYNRGVERKLYLLKEEGAL
jgi:O-6-methylguanine DNA methyltransferase